MLSWIVDHLVLESVLLLPIALAFSYFWWISRNNKNLIGVGVCFGLLGLAWALSLFVVTDRMQLVRNVEAMRDAINAGRLDEALDHFEEVVRVDTMGGPVTLRKKDLREHTKGNMRKYGVKEVVTNSIGVVKLARPDALVTFYVGPADGPERGLCKMGFVLAQDGKWRVKTFTVETVVGGHKTPLLFPF